MYEENFNIDQSFSYSPPQVAVSGFPFKIEIHTNSKTAQKIESSIHFLALDPLFSLKIIDTSLLFALKFDLL